MEKQTANFYPGSFFWGPPLKFFSNVHEIEHCSKGQSGKVLLKNSTELDIVVRWKAAFSQYIKHLGKT
ncbi:MAG: hypothetical protein MI974_22460 [Chitinophagales bacterium]|nr:hypothetical protein [Chitinophagales bacterium]